MGIEPPQRKGHRSSLAHLHRTVAHSRVQMRSLPRTAGHVLPYSAKETTMAGVGRIGEKGLVQSLAETWHSPERGTDLLVAHLPQGVCANEAFCPTDKKPRSSRARRRVFTTLSQLQSLMPLCPREDRRGWEVLPIVQAGMLPHWQKKLVSFS